MFHKVVWQHMQGEVWIVNKQFPAKFANESSSEKFSKLVEILQNYGHEFVASLFWPTLYI